MPGTEEHSGEQFHFQVERERERERFPGSELTTT